MTWQEFKQHVEDHNLRPYLDTTVENNGDPTHMFFTEEDLCETMKVGFDQVIGFKYIEEDETITLTIKGEEPNSTLDLTVMGSMWFVNIHP